MDAIQHTQLNNWRQLLNLMILLSQGSGMMSNESITSILELLTMHSVQQHASIHMQKALPVSPYFPALKHLLS